MITIRFEPDGKKVLAKPRITILDAAKEAGVGIRSECGGRGSCGKCKIVARNQLHVSNVSESELRLLTQAELDQGFRLACCSSVESNVVVDVPAESKVGRRKIQVEGMERPARLDCSIRKIHVKLPEPTIQDVKPDFERVLDALQKSKSIQLEIDYELLKTLPSILRDCGWNVTVVTWNDERIISVEEGNTENIEYGFSVDIGTSKIVGYLIDLRSGKIVDIESMSNPQLMYGEDIVSRIDYAISNSKGLEKLKEITIEAINALINNACQETGVNPNNIYEVTVVGNTAMHHFFLGIQPEPLVLAPYVPAIKRHVDIKADSLKIHTNPLANVHVLPVIAGFVGGDAVADVLATGMHEMDDMSLLLDVGTNGEIFVGNQKNIVSCSCAAGPAFEGMHIEYGMKAGTGAIEKLKIDPDSLEVEYETIDGIKPAGICGSGVVDVVAEMLRCRIIDQRGAFNKNIQTKRLRHIGGEPKFVVAWKHETNLESDMTISRKDIQEIQLAKAAMHASAVILMRERGVNDIDLDHVYIAGAFGKYLNPESARFIGLIPDVPDARIDFVGNTAISGAKMALTSRQMREKADELSKNIHYVEIVAAQGFSKEFMDSLWLPHRNMQKYATVADYFLR